MARIKQPALTPDALLAQFHRLMEACQRKHTQDDLDALGKLRREVEEDRKEARAWIIAAMGNYPLPIAFYEDWVCYQVLNKAERAGILTTIERKNGKPSERARGVCVRGAGYGNQDARHLARVVWQLAWVPPGQPYEPAHALRRAFRASPSSAPW